MSALRNDYLFRWLLALFVVLNVADLALTLVRLRLSALHGQFLRLLGPAYEKCYFAFG